MRKLPLVTTFYPNGWGYSGFGPELQIEDGDSADLNLLSFPLEGPEVYVYRYCRVPPP